MANITIANIKLKDKDPAKLHFCTLLGPVHFYLNFPLLSKAKNLHCLTRF